MISVVVPAYNAAGVIGKCIDSVLLQTYSDFELLIIDDGSRDETAEIVAAKAAQDARIHLIRQENAGVSSARNTGIAAASGELLCFIDSDDTVSANYLETLHTLYSPGALPVIDVVRSDRNGSALNPMPETFTLDGNWVDSYFCGQLRYGIAFSVCNKLFSLQTLRREHIVFLPELSIGEDMLFVFQYLHYCRSICFSKDAGYHYTIAQGSAMFSSRDYTQPYEKTFKVMSEKGHFPFPIADRTLSRWAFDASIIIIANPFIIDRNYAEFKKWWREFRQTALYRAAVASEKPSGYKRRVLHFALHSENTIAIYVLFRLLRFGKKK